MRRSRHIGEPANMKLGLDSGGVVMVAIVVVAIMLATGGKLRKW